MTARTAFAHLRGANEPTPTDIAKPQPCHHSPPRRPNVYTDGSLKHPTSKEYCLGGAGAWHPERDLANTGATEAETNLATFMQEADGLRLCNHLEGYGGSSTRLEITGAITALAMNGPANIGTDSQAFIDKATRLHQHIAMGTQPKRPWMLQKDGDIWQIYHEHAKTKTIQAITLLHVHPSSAVVWHFCIIL